MKKTNETGRSMVEMLGVLAIIGVLSIGGIAGYTMAMNKYQVNEIVNALNQAAVHCRTRGTFPDDVVTQLANLGVTINKASSGEGGTVASDCTRSTGEVKWAWKSSTSGSEDPSSGVQTSVCKMLGIATNNACPSTLAYTPES